MTSCDLSPWLSQPHACHHSRQSPGEECLDSGGSRTLTGQHFVVGVKEEHVYKSVTEDEIETPQN